MKKRLRKKLHRGEFRKWVFSVWGKSNSGDLCDDLLKFADEHGLMIGGLVGAENLDFIVDRCSDPKCTCGEYSATGVKEEDRLLIGQWLLHRCEWVEVSPRWDGYHGPDPGDKREELECGPCYIDNHEEDQL